MNNTYETSSLLLATTILCLGIPLDSYYKDQEGKFTFCFERSSNLDSILDLFWRKALKVEPFSFWENRKYLKGITKGG